MHHSLYVLPRLIVQGQATGGARRGYTDGSEEEKSTIRVHPSNVRRREEKERERDVILPALPCLTSHPILLRVCLVLRFRAVLLCLLHWYCITAFPPCWTLLLSRTGLHLLLGDSSSFLMHRYLVYY